MVHELPRDSRYVVLVNWRRKQGLIEDDESAEPDNERAERWEMRQWARLDRELAAGQLNTLNDLLRYVPSWKKTPPAANVVGPQEWWPEEQLKELDKKLRKDTTKRTAEGPSIEDVLAIFGGPG